MKDSILEEVVPSGEDLRDRLAKLIDTQLSLASGLGSVTCDSANAIAALAEAYATLSTFDE